MAVFRENYPFTKRQRHSRKGAEPQRLRKAFFFCFSLRYLCDFAGAFDSSLTKAKAFTQKLISDPNYCHAGSILVKSTITAKIGYLPASTKIPSGGHSGVLG